MWVTELSMSVRHRRCKLARNVASAVRVSPPGPFRYSGSIVDAFLAFSVSAEKSSVTSSLPRTNAEFVFPFLLLYA